MAYDEKYYLSLCKRKLEEKFSFGNGHGYTQKDLEQLANYIEEQTGNYISLSTLKRVWKNDFKTGPQVATLNALVQVLGYANWQDFKLENKEADVVQTERNFSGSKSKWLVYALLSLVVVMVFTFFFFKKESSVRINGPIEFSANKTLSRGVPNTFIFKYDLSNVEADSFFIQQTWNGYHRVKIDPEKKVFSATYYESGYHRARLLANDKIIATQPVHILSEGWEPHVYYNESDDRFIDFKGESFVRDGVLHLPKDLLVKRKLDTSRHFMSRISHSEDYRVSSNDFTFSTRIKLDRVQEANCPAMAVLLITTENIFKVGLVRKGCETGADYKLGEIYRSGRDNDLAKLGVDVYDWNDIRVEVKGKKAVIYINDEPAYTENFEEELGNIMGLSYIFEGAGSIDSARLYDGKGRLAFEDGF